MTLTEQGNGSYVLALNAGEKQMVARAVRRYGASALKSAIEAWLTQAGGAEAEAEDIKRAYLAAADAQVRSGVRAALGVE